MEGLSGPTVRGVGLDLVDLARLRDVIGRRPGVLGRIFSDEEVAGFLAGLLLVRYPALLSSRYGFVLDGVDAVAVVEGVAKKRSLILRGGGPDFEKASAVLVQDYREGKLGRISLETPETRRMMIGATNETPTLSTGQ